MSFSEYDPAVYGETAGCSARVVLGKILPLLSPTSVVDFGYGTGEWLKEARWLGVHDAVGVDGEAASHFGRAIGFETVIADLTQPVELDRHFDLAMSLEVGEHLPADAAATLVGSLTAASDIVLFSAAVPRQGGAGHINEAWPALWTGMFDDAGYSGVDLRGFFWTDTSIAWWYRMNLGLYVNRGAAQHPRVQKWAAGIPDAFAELTLRMRDGDRHALSYLDLVSLGALTKIATAELWQRVMTRVRRPRTAALRSPGTSCPR